MIEKIRMEYIGELEKRLTNAKASYESAKRDTIEAEGRMITRYDSSKTETAWLADGYFKDVNELENEIISYKEHRKCVGYDNTVSVEVFKNEKYIEQKEVRITMGENIFGTPAIKLIGLFRDDTLVINSKNETYLLKIARINEPDGQNDEIDIGDAFYVGDDYGELAGYFIVRKLGGMEVNLPDGEVFCISAKAPIAQLAFGKRTGDCICNNGERMVIKKIIKK